MKLIDLGRGTVLYVDYRDIVLSADIRQQVWDWAQSQKIQLEGQKYGINGLDVWRVRDDQQRLRFILRWL